MLRETWSLGDVRDVEAFCGDVLVKFTRGERAAHKPGSDAFFSPADKDDAMAYLLGEAWIAWRKFNPVADGRGTNCFSGFLVWTLHRRLVDWLRKRYGSRRYHPERLMVRSVTPTPDVEQHIAGAWFDPEYDHSAALDFDAAPAGTREALAYGLLTGKVASYARPFTESREYGRLDSKWSSFPGKPHLKEHHDQLLDKRRTLLAHNDLTQHRATIVWTRGVWREDRSVSVEARSPINAAGIVEVRELFAYQEERFDKHLEKLLARLQPLLGWPDAREVDLGLELERLGTDQTLAEFYATPRRRAEVFPLQEDS